ncbi:MAG: hypothetical protein SVZ03_02830 [Spirochaetota bacterium]|nr:hypothetical protein [Spirochaetota bacterium]
MTIHISKYKLFYSIIIIYHAATLDLSARPVCQHGPILKLFYAPFGFGNLKAPYSSRAIGSISSNEGDNNSLKSYSGNRVTLGYFYKSIQSEFSYFKASIKNQTIEEPNQYSRTIISGDSTFLDLKIGKRFSSSGDTSFSWLYIGGKMMSLNFDISGTEARGIGYLIGYYGFHSYRLRSDFEFAFNYDLFLGMYKITDLSSDIIIDKERDNSISAGFSVGIGIQYEPYNASCLLKFAPEVNQITYKGDYAGANVDLSASTRAAYIGLEFIYNPPNFKYNLRDN